MTAQIFSEGFEYQNNTLHCEGVSLEEIAASVGTPAYVYSRSAIQNRALRLLSIFTANPNIDVSIHFAVKALSNIHVLRIFKDLGCGADIVSGGELYRCALAGFEAEKICFSGVGKTEKEISEALKIGIGYICAESLAELFLIQDVARQLSKRAKVLLRLNPDVDAQTHVYVSTGKKENKFGISKKELSQIEKEKNLLTEIDFVGIGCHIGSQICDGDPFLKAWDFLLAQAKNIFFKVRVLNLGGGLGTRYSNHGVLELEDYACLIEKKFSGLGYHLIIEPGRSLVAPCGVLLSKKIYHKSGEEKEFMILDAGMNDLLRPALYQAKHEILSVSQASELESICVAGPVCESADVFSTEKVPSKSLLFAIGTAGAYGMSMASQYNSRPKIPEVLVNQGTFQIIRKRETYVDLVAKELES